MSNETKYVGTKPLAALAASRTFLQGIANAQFLISTDRPSDITQAYTLSLRVSNLSDTPPSVASQYCAGVGGGVNDAFANVWRSGAFPINGVLMIESGGRTVFADLASGIYQLPADRSLRLSAFKWGSLTDYAYAVDQATVVTAVLRDGFATPTQPFRCTSVFRLDESGGTNPTTNVLPVPVGASAWDLSAVAGDGTDGKPALDGLVSGGAFVRDWSVTAPIFAPPWTPVEISPTSAFEGNAIGYMSWAMRNLSAFPVSALMRFYLEP